MDDVKIEKMWLVTRSFEEDDAVWWFANATTAAEAAQRVVDLINADQMGVVEFDFPESWFVYAFDGETKACSFYDVTLEMFVDDPEEIYL